MSGVRVTGGTLKGRPLIVPDRMETRYTPSKVREALFHLLGPLDGAAFLDLFAGSGAVSVEALSRGAASATLVEKDPGMCAVIRDNMSRMELLDRSTIFNMDTDEAIVELHRGVHLYDIIFMDPPYDRGHVMKTIERLSERPVHRHNSILLVEHSKREAARAAVSPSFECILSRRYGDTAITMYRLHHTSSTGRTEWKHE